MSCGRCDGSHNPCRCHIIYRDNEVSRRLDRLRSLAADLNDRADALQLANALGLLPTIRELLGIKRPR
jgi:hypothetical protein